MNLVERSIDPVALLCVLRLFNLGLVAEVGLPLREHSLLARIILLHLSKDSRDTLLLLLLIHSLNVVCLGR